MFKKQLFKRLMNRQQGEGGEGGGGNAITPEVQAQIDAAVAAATTGLANKNKELLGKLKDTSTTLAQFEGIDPTAMKAMMKQFSDSEEAGLLAAGKLDEVVGKRVERMKTDYDKRLQAETEARDRAEAKAAKLADGTLSGHLRDAATKAGALPEALDDVVLRSRGLWRLNENGDVVAMNGDEVVMGVDGKTPLTPAEWAASLRETAPHLWPKAQGTNAPGNSGRYQPNKPAALGGNRTERVAAIAARFPELSKG